jgi:adenylate cyclase
MGDWLQGVKRRFAEVRRRRVLRALGVYIVAAWVLLQVADVTFEPLGLGLWARKALIIAVVAGVAPAAILAWIFDFTRSGIVRTDEVAREFDGSGAPPGTTPGTQTNAPAAPMSAIASMAVLPFSDLSQARDHNWFCDGLAEEIIDSLCCVRGLRVASRTASFRFRDGSVDPREIGRLLNVDVILEGSVRVSGDRMRVTAQLIDAQAGYHVWSETYERPTADVFAIQREIAENVARALKISVAGAAFRGENAAPRNMEAYEYYVRGRQLVGQFTVTAWRDAPGLFRRAIALDPGYAQAHAGLADTLAQVVLWRFAAAADVLPEATAAASRALDLAPDLAEAHVAQGHLRSLGGDPDGARRAFERAIELNPNLFEAWYYYARHTYARGEYARAADLFQRAFAKRPDDFTLLAFAGNAIDATGDKERGRAMAERAADGLLRQCRLEPENVRVHYMAAGTLQRLGRGDEGLPLVERALALRPGEFSTMYNVACFYSRSGNHERALDLLEVALRQGGGYFDWIRNDTDLDPLRGNARFDALMESLHDRADTDPTARSEHGRN